MQKPEVFLSIIIPAYNEEQHIQSTLESVLSYLGKQSYAWEVIVVSDGSFDKTVEIVNRFQQQYGNVIVIDNKDNKGKGYATREGMLKAQGTLCLLFDADNATSIEELEKLVPYIDRYGIVIGSVGIKGSVIKRRQPLPRVLIGKLGNLFIQALVLPGIQDSHRGFKLFTQEVVQNIFPKVTLQGWAFDVEVLALAKQAGVGIKEVPICWSHVSKSNIRPQAYLQVLIDVLRIRWRLCRAHQNQ